MEIISELNCSRELLIDRWTGGFFFFVQLVEMSCVRDTQKDIYIFGFIPIGAGSNYMNKRTCSLIRFEIFLYKHLVAELHCISSEIWLPVNCCCITLNCILFSEFRNNSSHFSTLCILLVGCITSNSKLLKKFTVHIWLVLSWQSKNLRLNWINKIILEPSFFRCLSSFIACE